MTKKKTDKELNKLAESLLEELQNIKYSGDVEQDPEAELVLSYFNKVVEEYQTPKQEREIEELKYIIQRLKKCIERIKKVNQHQNKEKVKKAIDKLVDLEIKNYGEKIKEILGEE